MSLMSRELSDVTHCVCRVCSVIVSAVPTHRIKYSARATVPADINNNTMERLWGEKEGAEGEKANGGGGQRKGKEEGEASDS